MNMDNLGRKFALRVKTRALLKSFPAEKRQEDSEKLCAILKKQAFFQNARAILFFASLPEEPDLWPLLNEALTGKKLVALPCFDADYQAYRPRRVRDVHVEIIPGQFGVREP